MIILDNTSTYTAGNRKANVTKETTPNETPAKTPQDAVEIDFSGNRPAHRNVKKMARAAAGVVGLAGIGKAAYDIATSSTVAEGLGKVALDLACAGVGIVGIDVASGVAHHWGDNYGLPKPKPIAHTKWHTDTEDSGYCLVGMSNSALDKIDFWPKWERTVHKMTGKTPLSWQVEPYRQYVAGEMDRETLEKRLDTLGINHPNR